MRSASFLRGVWGEGTCDHTCPGGGEGKDGAGMGIREGGGIKGVTHKKSSVMVPTKKGGENPNKKKGKGKKATTVYMKKKIAISKDGMK